MLARLFETSGISTVLVTNMPYWAEKYGTPRTLAVEFPFGHPLGVPGNIEMQRRVLLQALNVLQSAEAAGTIVHSEEPWPTTLEEALHVSHPQEPPPISSEMGKHIRQFLKSLRRGEN